MKRKLRWFLGLCAAAQIGSAALAVPCGGNAVLDASVVLALETEGLSQLLLSCSSHEAVTWDAQKLAQAASRLPGILSSGVDKFTFERKFQRVSLLFLDVRDKLVDDLYVNFDSAVAESLERVEQAYLEMAFAMSETYPAGPISDLSRR